MNRDARKFGRVALCTGGSSAEREISLRGGRAVARALESLGVEFETFDGPMEVLRAAEAGGLDRVFNLLHGRGGEDGSFQGALELHGLPVTGSGVLGSALTMDKLLTKRVWKGCGLPTPDWQVASSPYAAGDIIETLGLPVFVKPAREGSSIGMSRVEDSSALAGAIERALEHDRQALVERLIEGTELTAGVLGDQCLPLIGLETDRAFYDFDAKYVSGDTRYLCPCGLDRVREEEIARLCLEAFNVTGARGWGRVDLMLDDNNQPWLLEVNTTPGMTDQSLLPMAAKAAGVEFEELVWRILETSLTV